MTYGVTATGFNRKTVQEILEGIRGRQRSEISERLDLSTTSVLGQNNGIVADELGLAWAALEACHQGFDPDAATGVQLTNLGKLTGTPRRGADYSLVALTLDIDEDTELISGTHFASIDGDSASLWTPVEDYTSPSDGSHDVVFRSNETGPVRANSGTITVIHTTVTGWNSVTNAEDATPGRETDDDPTLRSRREAQLTATGSATVDAIRADVLAIEDVISCFVFENTTDSTDGDGLPPKSIEVLVFDGETPAVDDDVIAQAIWDSKPAGIRTWGDVEATAIDSLGNERTVYFSRAEPIEIYIDITVERVVADYVGDTAVKERIVESGREFFGGGDDVRVRRLDSVVFGMAGIVDVTAFELGTSPSPSGTANIAIGTREIASFDTSRITVTTTP